MPHVPAFPSRRPRAFPENHPAGHRRRADAGHGRAPWLRFLDAADLAGQRLDPRNLFAGHGAAKPAVGRVRPVCRHGGRPLRHHARGAGRRVELYGRPGVDGAGHRSHPVRDRLRRVHRPRSGVYGLRRRQRHHRPRGPGRQTVVGVRHLGRGQLVRPVRADAHRAATDFRRRLAACLLRAGGLAGSADGADGVLPARAGRGAWRRPAPEHCRSIWRSSAQPLVPAAGRRLFRLRLPAGVHRRAPARVPEGQGRGRSQCGGAGAGADRPVQHRRLVLRGQARRPAAQALPAVRDLFCAGRRHWPVRAAAVICHVGVPVCSGDGRAVAVHGTAHQRHHCRHFRRQAHVDAGGDAMTWCGGFRLRWACWRGWSTCRSTNARWCAAGCGRRDARLAMAGGGRASFGAGVHGVSAAGVCSGSGESGVYVFLVPMTDQRVAAASDFEELLAPTQPPRQVGLHRRRLFRRARVQ
uniref:Uncharacterized protein n=1 Tax=Tanacetum cinerariifolium TaxID=118510 RepID=A0A699GE82_TANCI|nr:hypothetical protein [Tanacetum cinerariifolium]